MELLTHHPGGSHGDEEASGMVFSLRQGGGTDVGFEKRVPSHEVSGRKVNIGEGGSQGVAPTSQATGWRGKEGGRATRAPWPLVGPLRWIFVPPGVFWIKRFSGFFLECSEHL